MHIKATVLTAEGVRVHRVWPLSRRRAERCIRALFPTAIYSSLILQRTGASS